MATAQRQRATVFAIKEESTAGTPILPTGNSDFIPVRMSNPASISPNLEILESDELLDDIGMTKGQVGKESPSGSHSFYLKHSETEGTAPEYALMLKSALGGQSTAAAEYNTVANSTTTLIKVDAAEGATFEAGEALLIKDTAASRNYSIRNIKSISTDDLTINFALANAPGTGINLGKAVLIKPTSEDHPNYSAWMYNASGGAIQGIAGNKSSSIDLNFPSAEQATGTINYQGIKYYFNPILVNGSNKYLDITDDGGTIAVSIPEKLYKSPNELADQLTSSCTAASVGSGNDTITWSYSSSTGKFSVTTDGSTLSFLWKTGTHGSDATSAGDNIGEFIGFTVSADDTGATSYTADSAISFAPYYYSQYTISNSNNKMNITDDIGTFTVTFTNGTYDLDDLCDHVASAMTAAGAGSGADTYTCAYNGYSNKFKLSSNGTVFSILWKTGTNGADGTHTHIGDLLGYSDAADDTAALYYVADSAVNYNVAASPSYDNADNVVVKNSEIFIGSSSDSTSRKASNVSLSISAPITQINSIAAETGVFENVILRREVTLTASILYEKYESGLFDKYINNTGTQVMVNIGPKSNGNWVAGKCINIYMPNATISEHKISGDEYMILDLVCKGYVDATYKDIYINFI